MPAVSLRFIQRCIEQDCFFITSHAAEMMIERKISLDEIKAVLMNAEIIEDEPDDRPYPSSLLLGWLETGDPLHVKCSRKPGVNRVRIVTVYEPDDSQWESDYKTRK